MQPFYRDESVSFYNIDCVTGMNELPDGLYDMIVTSPPYAVGKEYEERQSFGEYLKLLSDFYTASYRIIKAGGYNIVNFGDYYTRHSGSGSKIQPMQYLHHIIAERAGWNHKTTRIWQKDFATLSDKFSIMTNLPKDEYEYIATFRKPGGGKEKVREQKYHPRGVWSTAGKHQKVSTLKRHTAAFPEYLVRIILDVYSDPGDTVVDPFLGSGTTLYVAKMMDRKGVGFETNEEYCKISRLRLGQQIFEHPWEVDKNEGQSTFMEETNERSDAKVVEEARSI